MEEYGLVFSGGGARGAYEVGVWKALKELNIPIKAVVGTSVGALNGAFFVQDEWEKAYDFWTNMSMEDVISSSEEIASIKDESFAALFFITLKNVITSSGMDVTPMKNTLYMLTDEERIRKSPVDFGLVTFSVRNFKPLELYKEEIPEGKLVDYLLASACFPLFKPQEIGNDKYIDGGIHDNMPVPMLLKKGINNIIVVDIADQGRIKGIDTEKVKIIYIKNFDGIECSTLEFNGEKSKILIEDGYKDALRAFGFYRGARYYIKNTQTAESKYDNFRFGIEHIQNVEEYLNLLSNECNERDKKRVTYKFIRTLSKYTGEKLNYINSFISVIEIAATLVGVEKRKIYTIDELINEILFMKDNIQQQEEYKIYYSFISKLIEEEENGVFEKYLKTGIVNDKFFSVINLYKYHNDKNVSSLKLHASLNNSEAMIANMFVNKIIT